MSALISHRSMENPVFFFFLISRCLILIFLTLSLLFLNSLLLLLSLLLPPVLSPPIGDVPYSCPETAALHHSQCKSTHTLLLFTPPAFPLVSFLLSLSGFNLSSSCYRQQKWHLPHLPLSPNTPPPPTQVIISCGYFFTPVPFCLFHHLSPVWNLILLFLFPHLPSNPRHSLPNPLIPLFHISPSPCKIHFSPSWPQNLSSLLCFSYHAA